MNRTRQIRWLPLGLGVFIGVFVLAAVATLFRDDAAAPSTDIAGLDGACRRNVSYREYRLNAKLARRVLSDQAKAKWKSKAEQLVVTIPTLAGH